MKTFPGTLVSHYIHIYHLRFSAGREHIIIKKEQHITWNDIHSHGWPESERVRVKMYLFHSHVIILNSINPEGSYLNPVCVCVPVCMLAYMYACVCVFAHMCVCDVVVGLVSNGQGSQ
jgi:hypothetical protein